MDAERLSEIAQKINLIVSRTPSLKYFFFLIQLYDLKYYFENNFVHQICGEL